MPYRREEIPKVHLDWQPMETAPKDGTVVTVLCEGGEDFAAFDGEWTSHFGYGEPTAWRQFLGNLAKVRQVYS